MKIGDKVWVIVQDIDDGRNIALPEIPQHGQIIAIEIGHVGHIKNYYVWVDNDSLHIYPSNIFLSEDIAWASWESKMRSKCEEIQKKIDKRSST